MRPMTLLRAVAWVGAVIVFWSLNIRWGDADVGAGAPSLLWERHIVGAGLLALIAALAISVSGRGGHPPGRIARGIALAAAAGILIIALLLRRHALAQDFEHLLRGPGWTWLFAGGGLVMAAVLGTFGVKPPASAGGKSGKGSGASKKRRRR